MHDHCCCREQLLCEISFKYSETELPGVWMKLYGTFCFSLCMIYRYERAIGGLITRVTSVSSSLNISIDIQLSGTTSSIHCDGNRVSITDTDCSDSCRANSSISSELVL